MVVHTVYVTVDDDLATAEAVADELHSLVTVYGEAFSPIVSVDSERVDVSALEGVS